jgi:hypothetical protein
MIVLVAIAPRFLFETFLQPFNWQAVGQTPRSFLQLGGNVWYQQRRGYALCL